MTTKCVVCGQTPAYISFQGQCECANPKCRCYSPGLFDDPPEAVTTEEVLAQQPEPDPPDEVEDPVDTAERPNPVWIWTHHHHDFGD